MTDTAAQMLPQWDLTDLYAAPDDPSLAADLDRAAREAKAFAADLAGNISTLSGAELGAAIARYEELEDLLGRVGSYIQLLFATHLGDPKIGGFYQTTQEKLTLIGTDLLFFGLEINRLEDADLAAKLADPAAARYRPWLDDLRAQRPYQLDDALEKLLHEKRVSGSSAWIRLFEETMAALRFDVDGEALTASETLDLLSGKDAAKRRAAAKGFGKGLADNIRLFALITNTLAKDKEIEDRWRGYPAPISSRNLANLVEDEVVDALIDAVRAAYPKLSHRYYAMKAKWMGVEVMDYWDRNAPLPEDDDAKIPWNEAKRRVLDAYGAFSPDLRGLAERFFDRPWIDAAPREGKESGAFSHPTVPSAHPYVLLNYHGKTRDVMTLAHELGHGVHQVLAADQGALMADTPLTLAETASVFGEMLTFRAVLDGETDPARRRILLAGKVEDMLNTVVRQISFLTFEKQVHERRKQGELTAEELGEIWMDVQRESLGPSFRFDEEYACFWSYIPHFLHAPFYVYAYAFGDCLVNSLYDVFEDGHPGFQEKYLDMLRAGGSKRHGELLAPFGLNAADPAFWNRGLSVIGRLIDELEKGGE